MRLGGCPGGNRPGGVPSAEELATYNKICRAELTYPGNMSYNIDIKPTPAQCQSPPHVLDPGDWDESAMFSYITKYKLLSLSPGDIAEPQEFAHAGYTDGAAAEAPVENRVECKGRCNNGDIPDFTWTWYPGHLPPGTRVAAHQ